MTKLILMSALFLALTGSAAAQDRNRAHEQHLSGLSQLGLSSFSFSAGGLLLALDRQQGGPHQDMALGASVPLITLGATDLVLAAVDMASSGDSLWRLERRHDREQSARIALLFSGASVAAFGAYFHSDASIGAGLSVLGHSALRLLLNRLWFERIRGARSVSVGVGVVPGRIGTGAIATVTGSL